MLSVFVCCCCFVSETSVKWRSKFCYSNMAVISAGIVNQGGRVILARQFMEINRVRIEGLLSAFPRLRDASVKKQATFLDAGSVRYVYQPIENLFLVLITTLNSNIVEDLATLQIMGKVLSEYVGGAVSEGAVEKHAFNIFFAFDEIIVGGKRESSTLEEIQTYLEMDSVEERLYLEQKQQQMEAARKTTIEQARILKEKKMLGISKGGKDPYGGFGSDTIGMGMGMGGGAISGMGGLSSPNERYNSYTENTNSNAYLASGPSVPTLKPGTGMTLGKGKKNDRLQMSVLSKVQKEIGGRPSPGATGAGVSATPVPGDFKSDSSTPENVHVTIEEKMVVELTRDGEVSNAEVKGELSLLIKESHCERVKLELGPLNDSYSFKAHAKINKSLFANNAILAMTDGKPFPVNQNITILRWRAAGDVSPPVVFTCWPEIGRMTVEYEMPDDYAAVQVESLAVQIPLNGQSATAVTPTAGVANVQGDWVFWMIPVCSGANNQSGSIDITIADSNLNCGEVLFPITVTFSAPHSLANVSVTKVVEVDTEMPVRFSENVHLLAENYRVE